jgi:cytochrome c5
MRYWLFAPMLVVFGANADESRVILKEAAGRALVEAHCTMCHSLDYVQMNSVFLDRKGWETSVNKMIKVMGAPITQEDIGPIIEYLTKYYGK